MDYRLNSSLKSERFAITARTARRVIVSTSRPPAAPRPVAVSADEERALPCRTSRMLRPLRWSSDYSTCTVGRPASHY